MQVDPVHNFVFYFRNGLQTSLEVINHFENFEAGFCLDDFCNLTFVHFEDDIFELLGQLAGLERSEGAAFVFCAAFRITLGDFAELLTFQDAIAVVIGLLLDGFDSA